ncbi:3-hydroxyacyl-CoA dehydrogenase NAD-binding domain-containing protein [Salipiger sp. H15]|uniref:3-hydroxyacyl-CoA dehydrogenase NAD-binding domain-containing protein n=1 Tax=Alloyangia sp. H15 TaxID=3029062 RepID=A0AAU8AH85_9RHOB
MSDFSASTGDGVCTISWDTPGKSMNVMSLEALAELDALVGAALQDAAVKGIVITSAKPGSFAGGMDLNTLAALRESAGDDPAQGIFDGIMGLHAVLRRIERAGMDAQDKGGKPIACALPGTALGIGFELALACHRIFAAPEPKAKIGLPEIKVGLFPGAGGTTRLVRKLGAMGAAPYLLEGTLLSPDKAQKAGLIDEVAGDPLAAARDWVLRAAPEDLVKPWDRKGYRLPGGGPYHPAGFMTFVGASAMVNGKTKGVYPAARALLSAVYEGAQVPFDTALRIEARWFTHVMLDPSSSAMIRTLFVSKEALEKGARRPAEVPPQSVRKLGVLGAGMMGAGIALVAAQAGIGVVLLDRTQEAADKGRAHAEAYLDDGVKRGKTSPEQRQAVLDRLTATADFDALAGCDMIIEAVFEDPEVKAEVTRTALRHVPESCIFATNTSSLPINKLSEASLMPENFVGLHFFSPVEKMMLVEVIKGARTGPRAVAKALDFARMIRKTPIVVNDARFFYANRCIIPYLNEGIRMLREGVAPALIENAAKLAGMPLGPLQLVDETSIELGVKIAQATKAAMGESYRDADVDEVLGRMVELGRLGRKAGAGFYAYEDGKRLGLWEGLAAEWPVAAEQPDLMELQHRLLFVQSLEAVRALERHVLSDIREGDVGAVLGWGFAPWSGGPFSWLDMLGAPYAAARAAELAERHGRRFACPETLAEMARKGQSFYGSRAAGT